MYQVKKATESKFYQINEFNFKICSVKKKIKFVD